ncbi:MULTISPECIES: MFS transporter [Brevibacillus]|jgi:Arabinose efflux permease|uniref:Tetracycline resistance MFS efflux pump n=1 Tax=Brevibacillus parabrevis TaxID=54914 RepID=A0A4Y3PXE8_BREPA|nr:MULTISPECIES: MFS transporter [Brevibacillus]UED70107.1 MFS transporter [Brevibacillus sp. HD3.3A]MBU8712527.1 MFS transporter [Brevibacillus parabrevis]MED2256863.1 MFS transporter [Brevibacillus parabrevis]RNB96392.1 MFS transporter [Brevibacillus parabrevis]GEB35791.1 tetracycline resistance MFS efflux pump [Brevibacillus parabrevis]
MKRNNNQNWSLGLVLFNLFIAYVGIGLVVPVMPSFAHELNLSGEVVGYLISAFAFAQLLASPITGVWVDTFGRKKMIVFGLFLFAFSELMFGLGNQVWILFLSRVLGGISDAFIMPAVISYIADRTSLEDRARVLGYQAAAISGGFIIGPGLGGFIAELGIRAPFFFAAGFAGIAAVISLFVLEESLTKEQMAKNKAQKVSVSFIGEIKKSFRSIYFVPLLIVFVLSFGLAAYEMMFSLFVDAKFGFTAKDIAVIITVGSVFGVVAQIAFFEKLVDKFGEKNMIQTTLVTAALFIFATVFINSYWGIMVVSSIVFFACDLLRPAVTTLLSKMADEDQGFVAGMNSTYTSLGIIVGPAVGGILFDWNINFPYMFAAVVLCAAFALFVYWKNKLRAPAHG